MKTSRMTMIYARGRTVGVQIRIRQYERKEWLLLLDGNLWASGDCDSNEDGFFRAKCMLRGAGLEEVETGVWRRAVQP